MQMDVDARTYLHTFFEGSYHISYIYIHIILNYVLFGHYADKIRNRMMDTEDSRLQEDFE